MCGIAGAFGPAAADGPLAAMGSLLTHRGPDGVRTSLSTDPTYGFAHTRLSILDLTTSGSQPMTSPSGVQIVYNGEIYNYLELRGELEQHGARFFGTSDTEVLLASYDLWGDDCIPRLNGMFAFALFDPRRGKLVAARDRLGEKPFYYTWAPDGTFVFASEVKALLAFPGVQTRANYTSVYRLLAHREIDRDPETFFEEIRSLPPAHSLELRLGERSLHLHRYWALKPAEPTQRTSEDLEAGFRELFIDSVRLRLRSDVAVGSSLSGGLDSSAIVGAIARLGAAKGQHVFSARFPGTSADEGRYIESVVAKTGVIPHDVVPDPMCVPGEWDSLAWYQESPFLSLSVYAQWCVMRAASKVGVTVLLDGQGADELLAGYRFYAAGQLRDLVRRGRLVEAFATLAVHIRNAGLRDMPAVTFHALPPRLARRIKRSVRAIGLDEEFARAHGVDPQAVGAFPGSTLTRMLHTSLTMDMLPSLLRYGDRNSMAFSRELRLPFLDYRLVEYAFTLPDDAKLSSTRTKVILRDSLRDLIPQLVAERRDKLGYAPPQSEWLRGPLRQWVGDVLHSQSFVNRPWIDARLVDRAWHKYLRGASRYEPDIAKWLSLEGWARVFLDGARPARPGTGAGTLREPSRGRIEATRPQSVPSPGIG